MLPPMITTIVFSFASVILISLVSLIGLFTLSLKPSLLDRCVFVLVSVAVGALLGDAFIHLIPEAFETTTEPLYLSLALLGGLLLFFVLEKFLHWHHHQGLESSEPTTHPVGKMVLISDGVHNFIDGLIIVGGYMVSVEVGIATTIAVILHEIPQEIGDFGVLLHSGYTKTKALWLNFLSALFAIAGAALALVLGSSTELFATWLIPFAAGGFIYIAMSDLIPELHKTKVAKHSAVQILGIVAGIGAMLLLLLIEAGG